MLVLIPKGIKKLSETSLRKSEAKPSLVQTVNTAIYILLRGLKGQKGTYFFAITFFSIVCSFFNHCIFPKKDARKEKAKRCFLDFVENLEGGGVF